MDRYKKFIIYRNLLILSYLLFFGSIVYILNAHFSGYSHPFFDNFIVYLFIIGLGLMAYSGFSFLKLLEKDVDNDIFSVEKKKEIDLAMKERMKYLKYLMIFMILIYLIRFFLFLN